MLSKISIRNFKRFEQVEIELGNAVVFLGPNNSGKTTALQALALWDIGVRRWNEKRKGKGTPEKRSGVTINRRDLLSIPIPDVNLLWRDLHVRNIEKVQNAESDKKKQKTENIRIDIIVEGIFNGKEWKCGIEFDYANAESFYCRPLRLENVKNPPRMTVPAEIEGIKLAFLPPMSGLAAVEPKWEPGRINVLLGEGQTAQVLRNLCYQLYTDTGTPETKDRWNRLVEAIKALFGVELIPPSYIVERGEITMEFKEPNGTRLDISSSGRGLQQTLLLLAHLYANPGTVLLLDEPDAHLEILRQKQIYKLLTDTADIQGSQLIAASHSEALLNEAANRDIVIAFLGAPHRIDDRGSQLLKSLSKIGFEHYYQAEQTGWVLYLEGSTDLAILRSFAQTLGHEAIRYLDRPFVHYVGNDVRAVSDHFYGLREAKPDLAGVAIFDRLDRQLPDNAGPEVLMWRKREIENYLCMPSILRTYARQDQLDDLFGQAEADKREGIIDAIIKDRIAPAALRDPNDAWWRDTKMSDEFLDRVFDEYFKQLELPNLFRKTDYHRLASLVPKEDIDPEITEKLDLIVNVAKTAKPKT